MTRKNIKWPKELKFWQKHTSEEIATQFGVHRNTVSRYRRQHRLPCPPRRGGPGRTPIVDKTKIRLDKTADWNARKQGVSENWMFQLMSAMRKEAERAEKAAKRAPRQPDSGGEFWS
jgi:hypothetical protein